jgi:hypothetical protein
VVSGINQFQTGPWFTPSIATPTGNRRPDWVSQLLIIWLLQLPPTGCG